MNVIYIKEWLEQEIKPLRGRDLFNFEIVLFSDMGEAHSEVVRDTCAEYGVSRQTTAGYTPEHNAFIERWFRTNPEMSRCQLAAVQYGRDILGGLEKNGYVYIQSSTTCQTHTGEAVDVTLTAVVPR